MDRLEEFKNLCESYDGRFDIGNGAVTCNINPYGDLGEDGFKALAVWLAKRKDDLANELNERGLKYADLYYTDLNGEGEKTYEIELYSDGDISLSVSDYNVITSLYDFGIWLEDEYGENAEFDSDRFWSSIGKYINQIDSKLPPNHYLNGGIDCEVFTNSDYDTIDYKCSINKLFKGYTPHIPSTIEDMERVLDMLSQDVVDTTNELINDSIIRTEKIC